MIPNRIFITNGVGRHKEKSISYQEALKDAGIEQYTLSPVSAGIIPPDCKIIQKEEGLKFLKPGQIIHTLIARSETNESSRLIAASIGYAVPSEKNAYGYLLEHSAYGQPGDKAGDYAEDLAATMLASTLGIPFDPNLAWDDKQEIFKMSKEIVRTHNITQSAEGKPDGLWTTVLAAAVLLKVKRKDLEAITGNQ